MPVTLLFDIWSWKSISSQSWQLRQGLSHSCLQSRHCELPSPFRDSLHACWGPPDRAPSPTGQHSGSCSAGQADPAHPALALAVPQASWSVSGGSLRVGILEEDQAEKCGTRWWATAAPGKAAPTLSLGAGYWQLNTFCDNSISCEKNTTALGYYADYCLPLKGVYHFPSSLGGTHYPFLPHSDSILLSCVLLQIFTCPPSELAWQCAYLALFHICLFLSQEMLKGYFNALERSVSNKLVCVPRTEQCP